jgi:hypothetical protein
MGRKLLGPPGWPAERYVARLRHGGMAASNGSFRRAATRMDPVLWSLVYLPHHLTLDTADGPVVSLSEFHIALTESAKRWARTDLAAAEMRDAWIAPRGSGKSTMLLLALPLWALANQHRRFVLTLAHSGTMARDHLSTLRRELETNELLHRDYPRLCTPAKTRAGGSVANRRDSYQSASGVTIAAKGMDETALGAKVGSTRPDLICADDLERDEGTYSMAQKEKRLATLRIGVLPMNDRAVVSLSGTTTMWGSISHDLVRSAAGARVEWVEEERFRCHHFPALMTDDDGNERSLWEQRWPLTDLQSRRGQRSFAMNMMCLPYAANGTHWSPDEFVYDDKGVLARNITGKVLCVDPAVTSSKSADETGLAVVSYAGNVRRCLVERAMGVRRSPKEVQELVHRTLIRDPLIREVVAEVNQGGEYILQSLSPLPNGVRLTPSRASESKASRITGLYYQYQDKKVCHAKPLPALERQMCSWPNVDTDDIVDAVEAGVRHWLGKYQARPS